MIETDEYISLSHAAKIMHVEYQAVYAAVVIRKKLPGIKHGKKWYVKMGDLTNYRINKFDRSQFKIDGELVFDLDKGHFSIQHVAKVISHTLNRPYKAQRIYYLARKGKIHSLRKGRSWVISRDDAVDLLERERGEDFSQLRMF